MRVRASWSLALAALALLAAGAWRWHDDHTTRFLATDTAPFVALFRAPPAADSAEARAELDQLLAMQRGRTPTEALAARADRKTEVSRFYGALGLPDGAAKLPHLERLAQRVEDDVRIRVRAVKDHFRRLRPPEIEPRLEPCIDDVKRDLSYPSGHAAYGWSMAYLLSEVAPERRTALEARAEEYARQRMVCGVHFPSDLAAGKMAARRLLDEMKESAEFRAELDQARQEYRSALAALGRRADPP
jgi:acid phosphatase (class A)